jgi:hypothetical protein
MLLVVAARLAADIVIESIAAGRPYIVAARLAVHLVDAGHALDSGHHALRLGHTGLAVAGDS